MLGRFLLLVAAVSVTFPSDVTASCRYKNTCEKCLKDERCFWYVGNNTCYYLPQGKTYPGPAFYWSSRWANNCIFDSWAFLVTMLVITGFYVLGVIVFICFAIVVCCEDDDEGKEQRDKMLPWVVCWPCAIIGAAIACACLMLAAYGAGQAGNTSSSGGSSSATVVEVTSVEVTSVQTTKI
ncbi:uncharacterized protein LOC144859933 [Branchiostoma floridae x Branchiostoma japonicum]